MDKDMFQHCASVLVPFGSASPSLHVDTGSALLRATGRMGRAHQPDPKHFATHLPDLERSGNQSGDGKTTAKKVVNTLSPNRISIVLVAARVFEGSD